MTAEWTTRRLMEWMTGYLKDRHVDSPRVVTDMLLSHAFDCERMRLYMDVDRPASPDELAVLRDLVKRAGQHEPAQYLVGEAWFYGRAYEVNASTLIPRPSTESLVELVLNTTRGIAEEGGPASHGEGLRIADIGTGTGCIAISLAAQLPGATIVATDIVEDALELARRNAERHDVSAHIEFVHGSLVEPLRSMEPFDIVCSNPPYISDVEWSDLAPNVRDWEPTSALRAGTDGLDCIRPLLEHVGTILRPDGRVFIEIAAAHAGILADLIGDDQGLHTPEIHRDLEGHDRILVAHASGTVPLHSSVKSAKRGQSPFTDV